MKEIGGYLEFEHYHGEEYHKEALAINSGRHCMEYLIRAKGIQKVHLPYYLCSSVAGLCSKLGIAIEYYHIDPHFTPLTDKQFLGNEWLYIVNYYGLLSNETILKLKHQHHNIIIDNTHAFFQQPVKEVDTLYSCRKFFGVPDGGYLYTDATLDCNIEQDLSHSRMAHLLGRYEGTASEFYTTFKENDKHFCGESLKTMSKLTHNLLRGIDYHFVKQRRTSNFAYLHHKIGNQNRLNPCTIEGAYMYPFYAEHGEMLRQKLQQYKIYIPTLWAEVFDSCQKHNIEYDFAQNILPLPIDQRYTEEDLDYYIAMILPLL